MDTRLILELAVYFLFGAVMIFRACCPVFSVGLTSRRKQSSFASIKIGCASAVTSVSVFSFFLIRKSCSPLNDGIFSTASSSMYFQRPSSSIGCVMLTSHSPFSTGCTIASVGKRVISPFLSNFVFSGLYICIITDTSN